MYKVYTPLCKKFIHLLVQGDMLDFDPNLARYCHLVVTRGLFYWNPHAILDKKH